MPPPPRGNLATWLWLVAYSALAMAALVVPADAEGMIGLVMGGHLLWALAYVGDGAKASRPGAAGFVAAVLAVAGLGELFGIAAALSEARAGQAVWFGAALTFVLVGVATAYRRGPSDGALACQVFFHALMTFPALAFVANRLLRSFAGASGAATITGAGPLTGMLFLIISVAVPLLFTALAITLAHDLTRPREKRDPLWASLLAHQAAFVVMGARCFPRID